MSDTTSPSCIEGTYQVPEGAKFALVAGRFNHFITDRLVEGALDALRRHGVGADQITLVHVPGAFEIPWAVSRLAKSGKVDAVVALGAVIRGSTPHFDYVAGDAAKGCGAVMLETGVPVLFGILTTDSIEQAIERSGTKAGNKGAEAALSAVEMVSLAAHMTAAGV